MTAANAVGTRHRSPRSVKVTSSAWRSKRRKQKTNGYHLLSLRTLRERDRQTFINECGSVRKSRQRHSRRDRIRNDRRYRLIRDSDPPWGGLGLHARGRRFDLVRTLRRL